jgi:hypothetical protein
MAVDPENSERGAMPLTRVAKVQTKHPQPGKLAPRISRIKYDAIRDAILRVVPRHSDGIPFQDVPDLVQRVLPRRVKERFGSITWYTVTVKLDLEARGVLERVPGARPQRIRRRR